MNRVLFLTLFLSTLTLVGCGHELDRSPLLTQMGIEVESEYSSVDAVLDLSSSVVDVDVTNAEEGYTFTFSAPQVFLRAAIEGGVNDPNEVSFIRFDGQLYVEATDNEGNLQVLVDRDGPGNNLLGTFEASAFVGTDGQDYMYLYKGAYVTVEGEEEPVFLQMMQCLVQQGANSATCMVTDPSEDVLDGYAPVVLYERRGNPMVFEAIN